MSDYHGYPKQPNILAERIRCAGLMLLLCLFFSFGAIMLAQSIVDEGSWLEYLCWGAWTLAGGFYVWMVGIANRGFHFMLGGEDIA
jgi:hypothetical protein